MTFLIWPSQFGNTLWNYLNMENGMCSVCKTAQWGNWANHRQTRYVHLYSWQLVNTDVWQLLYDVKRASSRSSGRHITAAECTGVTPSVCAVGSMPNGCHIHECHDWKVPVPETSYICSVLGVRTGSVMIRLTWKTWYSVNVPSLIMADDTMTPAIISITPSQDIWRTLKAVMIYPASSLCIIVVSSNWFKSHCILLVAISVLQKKHGFTKWNKNANGNNWKY